VKPTDGILPLGNTGAQRLQLPQQDGDVDRTAIDRSLGDGRAFGRALAELAEGDSMNGSTALESKIKASMVLRASLSQGDADENRDDEAKGLHCARRDGRDAGKSAVGIFL
jgi:hypothetical protein